MDFIKKNLQELGQYQYNYGLAPWDARSSAAMALTRQDKWGLVFYTKGTELPAPISLLRNDRNPDRFSGFLK